MTPEVCPEHSGMLERTKNIDEKCDAILSELRSTKKDIWDRVNQHIDESPEIRSKVHSLDAEFKLYKQERSKDVTNSQWRVSLTSSIIMGIFAVLGAVAIAKWVK